MHGVMEASGSLDTLGICARAIEDVALYRDVLLGIPPEPIVASAAPPRIGFCRTHVWGQVHPATQKLLEDAADRLAHQGARVEGVELPPEFEDLTEAHRWISSFEFVRTMTYEIENHWDRISDTLRGGRITDGLNCSFERYMKTRALAEHCRAAMALIWEDHDVLLSAAAIDEAPVGSDAFAGADLYKMWTVLHVPALTLPVLEGPKGMPVGLQLFAGRGRDRQLFAQALWVHRQLTC